MDLEELRAMKEKTDSMIETLKNDRTVLVKAKKEKIESNNRDFQTFLDSLIPYAQMIDKPCRAEINVSDLFAEFKDSHGYKAFYWEDMYIHTWNDEMIRLFVSGSNEGYEILICKDKATLVLNEYRSNYMREQFKTFVLEHAEEVKAYVEDLIKLYLEELLRTNKKTNDDLFKEIESITK